MTTKRIEIELKQGVNCRVLLTPALYGIGKERGIDLTQTAGQDSTRTYAKIAYCAAINDWEVRRVDAPLLGDFPYTFEDFDAWAVDNPKDLLRFIDTLLLAFTGKGIKQYAKEAKSDGLKKKMKS